MSSRLDSLREMVERSPDNPLARFGLANELVKAGMLGEARGHYEAYLAKHDDEGNGWGRYADVLERLGETELAREALTRGMAAAERFGHPGMAAELEERRDGLGLGVGG